MHRKPALRVVIHNLWRIIITTNTAALLSALGGNDRVIVSECWISVSEWCWTCWSSSLGDEVSLAWTCWSCSSVASLVSLRSIYRGGRIVLDNGRNHHCSNEKSGIIDRVSLPKQSGRVCRLIIRYQLCMTTRRAGFLCI